LGIIVLGFIVLAVVAYQSRRQSRQRTIEFERQRQYQQEKQRQEREFEKERRSSLKDYKGLVEQFATVIGSCSAPWDEVRREANALHGPFDSPPFDELIRKNALSVLGVMGKATGGVPNEIARLYQALFAQLETELRLTVQDCAERLSRIKDERPELPIVIIGLSAYDSRRQTTLSADVADAFSSLVITASRCCSPSFAVGVVRDAYLQFLAPYASAKHSSNTGNKSSSNGSQSKAEPTNNCVKCRAYYPILGAKLDASEAEVKTQFRSYAQIYHPDKYTSYEKQVQQTAEDEMKQVNVAYGHIMYRFKKGRCEP
jgi:hypothetical protein